MKKRPTKTTLVRHRDTDGCVCELSGFSFWVLRHLAAAKGEGTVCVQQIFIFRRGMI